MNKQERVRKNNSFVERFRNSKPRLRMPEYIANQKNDGVELGPNVNQPKGRGKGPSERAKIASRVQFSVQLKSVTTNRQLKTFALKVADQILSKQRKSA